MLSNTSKKYLIAGVIAMVTITGALAYLQYKKLMNYIIKVNYRLDTKRLIEII
jgi:hypothetical protein